MKWEADTYLFQTIQGEMNLVMEGHELLSENPLTYQVQASGKELRVQFGEENIVVFEGDQEACTIAIATIDEWVDEEAEALGFLDEFEEE
ncbi:hypothetical protein [Persicobacter psychrovividus]|uniref:Uncharacterized protein n=1 Tax=Persicobacter psychrovividus TaxID=387638 RepID=A0ABN6LBZ4_9BACT|nr:hypothetical protein PEPS_11220 [Persicobacter psychrovividus]